MLCIGLYHNRNRLSRGYAVPFALLFGMVGYNLHFSTASDLDRYYDIIDRLAGQNLLEILNADKSMLYTMDILFCFVSKTGSNGILAYIVGFFCYLIMFYVFFDTVIRYRDTSIPNCNIHILMTGLVMVSIINPFSIIGNVRCVFAFFMISFAAYRDWVQKKRNLVTLLLYLVPVGLHTAAVTILFVRICAPFLKKIPKAFVALAVLIPALIRFLYEIIFRTNLNNIILRYVRNAIIKAYQYLNWTRGGWATQIESSIANKVERSYGTFFLIVIIILYYVLTKEKETNSEIKIYNFLFIIAILALGSLSIKTGAFWRYEAIVVGFSPLILISVAMRNSSKGKALLVLLYATACVMLVLNVIRFTRNIVMDQFVVGCLNTSTLKVIGEILHGIFNMF